MKVYSKINKCRICKSKELARVFDLKNQYIQGSFEKENFPKPYQKKNTFKTFVV